MRREEVEASSLDGFLKYFSPEREERYRTIVSGVNWISKDFLRIRET